MFLIKNMNGLRLFIAVFPPEKIKNQLLEYQQKKLAKNKEIFRITPLDALHLTLVFIGDSDEKEKEKIIFACRKTAALFSPFQITLENINYGPNEKLPRLVWLEGKSAEELIKLEKTLRKNFYEIAGKKITGENHNFKAHITLARIKNNSHKPLPQEIKERKKITFWVEKFFLMNSQLDYQGAKYKIIDSFSLK